MKPQRTMDKYALYEASVQDPAWDIANLTKIYRTKTGREPRLMREDFCATAAISFAWAARHRDNRAIAVDLDPAPLAWAKQRRQSDRVTFVQGDVRIARKPLVDLAFALNFSWWVFRERSDLLAYLRASHASLRKGGLLIMNAFGGTDAERPTIERTRKRGFTYIWEHEHMNAVDRNLLAHIHFEMKDGRKLKRAFTYDWRMWTLPEVRDVALEAGFDVDIWREADGRLSRPRMIDNHDCWFANIVCSRP